MAIRQKTIPIREGAIDEALSERAERQGGLDCMDDVLGNYLEQVRDEFLVRFRQAQEALASQDDERIRQLEDAALQAEAEAIIATYPK